MYQFTRDFVINDNKGKIKDADGNLVRFATKAVDARGNKALMIDHVANLRAFEVASIYKRAWQEAKNESIELSLEAAIGDAELAKGDVLRLVITLGQEGRELSTFNDQYPWHARHYFYEGLVKSEDTAAADVLEGIVAGINRDNSLSDLRYFDIEGTPSTTSLKLAAADPYVRFAFVRLVKVGKTDPCGGCSIDHSHVGETLTGFMDWDELLFADRRKLVKAGAVLPAGVVAIEAGTEGAGNAFQIIKNLRVPTFEHMDWFGMNIGGVELPVPNGEYDQYLVEYVTERRHIGHQVMGAIDKSLVSFVFFVLKGEVSDQFKAALVDLGCAVADVNTVGDNGDSVLPFSEENAGKAFTHGYEPAKVIAPIAEVENPAEYAAASSDADAADGE